MGARLLAAGGLTCAALTAAACSGDSTPSPTAANPGRCPEFRRVAAKTLAPAAPAIERRRLAFTRPNGGVCRAQRRHAYPATDTPIRLRVPAGLVAGRQPTAGARRRPLDRLQVPAGRLRGTRRWHAASRHP